TQYTHTRKPKHVSTILFHLDRTGAHRHRACQLLLGPRLWRRRLPRRRWIWRRRSPRRRFWGGRLWGGGGRVSGVEAWAGGAGDWGGAPGADGGVEGWGVVNGAAEVVNLVAASAVALG